MDLEKTPSQKRIRDALARIYEEQPPQLKEYLRRYKEDPKSRVFAPLAEAYRKLGKLDEAIEICRSGLEHHPEFYGGRVALAKCYIDVGDSESAILELNKVVDKVPENILAQKLLGECFLKRGDKESALRAYKMALVQAPEDEELEKKIHDLRGQVLAPVESRVPEESVFVKSAGETPKQNNEVTQPEKDPPSGANNSELVPMVSVDGRIEMVPFQPTDADSNVNKVLGFEEDDDEVEAFSVAHVSDIFQDEEVDSKEITTETLGDLYMAQGQFEKALKIFEQLAETSPTPTLGEKMIKCREKMGVSAEEASRNRQIQALNKLLQKVSPTQ